MVQLQATQTGVARSDPEQDMFGVPIAGVAWAVAARAIYLAMFNVLYCTLQSHPSWTLSRAAQEVRGMLDGWGFGAGVCAESYLASWMPFTAEEAKYVAFAFKVPVDILPCFCRSVTAVSGQPFVVDPAASDLMLHMG